MYQLRLKPKAQKELKRIPEQDQSKILVAFTLIRENPFIGKKLRGRHKGLYSLRIWPYRVIYGVYKHELLIAIVSVGHRQGIYN